MMCLLIGSNQVGGLLNVIPLELGDVSLVMGKKSFPATVGHRSFCNYIKTFTFFFQTHTHQAQSPEFD